MNVELPIAFRPLFSPARYKAYFGGRGSAKSHSFATALVVLGAKSPMRFLCCREIQKSIKDSVKLLIDDKINQLELNNFYTSTDAEVVGKNGTQFFFAGLKTNPEALKSMEGIDICWIEEANTVSQKSLDLLIPTIRKPGSELWFSWNPDQPSDAVDKMFRGENPPPNSIIQQVSWRDNPYFPEVLIKDMEHDKVTNLLKYQHVWEGGYDLTTETKILRRIKENATATIQEAIPDTDYIMGVDLARKVDWTVIVVFNAQTHKMVYFDRFNQVDWSLQKARIEAVARRYNNALVRIDATGVGDPITEDLERVGLRIEPYIFTQNSKKDLVDNLALLLEQDDIKIIQIQELIDELNSFRLEKTISGKTRYEAPEGQHDDCVMALALACWKLPPKQLKVYKDLLTDEDITITYNQFGEPIIR